MRARVLRVIARIRVLRGVKVSRMCDCTYVHTRVNIYTGIQDTGRDSWQGRKVSAANRREHCQKTAGPGAEIACNTGIPEQNN